MTTSPTRNSTTPLAANDRTGLASSPRVKLSRRRISIDHPDPRAGERLLADALGAVDRDALDGLLKQLVKASVIGHKPDEANLAFMISMMKSIAPRDSIEAMLAAQMVCVHVLAMRCANRLAYADDMPRQDSASRALAKLVRIFPAQIEALRRYRNNGERAIGRRLRGTRRSIRISSCRSLVWQRRSPCLTPASASTDRPTSNKPTHER